MNFLKKDLFGIPRWVYLAAFLPRLALLAAAIKNPAYCVTNDALGYLALASGLTGHGFFGMPGPGGALVADTLRTPGYPIFLAAVGLLPGNLVLNAAAAQLLLGALTALLAWKWFEEIAGRRGAAFGVLFFTLDYVTLMHSPILLSEVLQALLLLLAGRATWKALDGAGALAAANSGLLWALATFIKPVTMYLPPALALFFWRRKKHLLLFLLFCCALPLGWSWRNYARTGCFTYSSMGGFILLKYSGGSVEALRTGKSFGETSAALLAAADGDFPNDAVRANAYAARAKEIIKEHPVLTARYLLHDLLATAGGTGIEMLPQALGLRTDFPARPGAAGGGTRALLGAYPELWPLQAGYMLFLAALYFLFALGLRALWLAGRRRQAGFLLITVFYLFAMASTNGYYRYRIPAMVFLAAGAAAALGEPAKKTAAQPDKISG
jgi:hypothetical protein